ncbi:Genome sequencing data, contig C326 [Microcystis aeruginosa PCC 9443]|uniref:Genome sequencing data, contig C326 n=1 Tax=Microcystis aeruginosa PCC 9443 TaxID=1160281 RepID=I4G3G9_MICAE|nr:Genome sequencing data, contig C326 [Microcystis aeruginosa PCC 9443]
MHKNIPSLKPKALIKILEKGGCQFYREGKGDHRLYCRVLYIAITLVVRYRVLGFEESEVKILVYLMRLGNAIINVESFLSI